MFTTALVVGILGLALAAIGEHPRYEPMVSETSAENKYEWILAMFVLVGCFSMIIFHRGNEASATNIIALVINML